MIQNWVVTRLTNENRVEVSVQFSTPEDAVAFSSDIDWALQEQFDAQGE